MFRTQTDRSGPITPKPSATLPADMKQMSFSLLSLWEQDTQTQIPGGLDVSRTPSAPILRRCDLELDEKKKSGIFKGLINMTAIWCGCK